jgi:hypothetical protein
MRSLTRGHLETRNAIVGLDADAVQMLNSIIKGTPQDFYSRLATSADNLWLRTPASVISSAHELGRDSAGGAGVDLVAGRASSLIGRFIAQERTA